MSTRTFEIDGKPLRGALVPHGQHVIRWTTTNKSGISVKVLRDGVQIASKVAVASGAVYVVEAPLDTTALTADTEVTITVVYAESGQTNRQDVGTFTSAAPVAGPLWSGCRIPRADLIVTTAAEAAGLTDLSGRLILGDFIPTVTQVGTDFRVEANRKCEALIKQVSGVYPVYEHFTISGLERDAAGNPVTIHEVRQGLWNQVKADWAVIEFTNDGYFVGSGGRLTNSYVHSHTVVTWGTPPATQHRDGTQMQQGGGQRVEDNLFDNRFPARPTLADGTAVPGAAVAGAASSFQINSDNPITGVVRYNRNRSIGGTSVHLNATTGQVDANGAYWWQQVRDADGNLVRGLEALDNISIQTPTNSTNSGAEALLPRGYTLDPSNVRADGTPWKVIRPGTA